MKKYLILLIGLFFISCTKDNVEKSLEGGYFSKYFPEDAKYLPIIDEGITVISSRGSGEYGFKFIAQNNNAKVIMENTDGFYDAEGYYILDENLKVINDKTEGTTVVGTTKGKAYYIIIDGGYKGFNGVRITLSFGNEFYEIENNDTMNTAYKIIDNQEIYGNSYHDQDYFTFLAKNPQMNLVFKYNKKENPDAVIEILDASGAIIKKIENDQEIISGLTPNKYYFIMTLYSSKYEFSFSFDDCKQIENDNKLFKKGEKISHWYEFIATSTNSILHFNATNNLISGNNFKVKLMNEDGNILKDITGNSLNFESGTILNKKYYVNVINEETTSDGSYILGVDFDNQIRELEPNNTYEEASPITANVKYKGYELGGSDYYKLVPSSTSINIAFDNLDKYNVNSEFKLRLIDSNKSTIMKEEAISNSNDGNLITGLYPGKEYYIEVFTEKGFGGNYEIGYNNENELWEIENNDTYLTANNLVANATYKGWQVNGVDWFKYVTNSTSATIEFTNLQPYDLNGNFKVSLVNYDGKTIIETKESKYGEKLLFTKGVLKDKTYYIKIESLSNEGGNYSICYK